MKYVPIAAVLLFSLMHVHADQLEYLTLSEAEQATEYLSQFDEIVSFCGCCDDDVPVIIRITNVEFRHTGYEEYYEVLITGENNLEESNSEVFDMAYIWVNIDGKAQFVGKQLNFECDPCSEPFLWPDPEINE